MKEEAIHSLEPLSLSKPSEEGGRVGKKNQAKKCKKTGKSVQRHQQNASAAGGSESGEDDPLSANYGSLEIQSQSISSGRVWTGVKNLNPEMIDKTVLIRGFAQVIQSLGKMTAFIVIRESMSTVLCVLGVSEAVSPRMVEFVRNLSRESVVNVEGVVALPDNPIEATTQKVEVHVRKVYCICRAVSNLPFKIEDAARSKAEIKEAERDWTDLPAELLHKISNCVPLFNDFIQFRSVCPEWRSATTGCPRQLPLVLIDCRRNAHDYEYLSKNGDIDIQFYSLFTQKVHTVTIPEANRRAIAGPANVFVLTSFYSFTIHNSFLNLLTGEEMSIPSVPTEKFGDLLELPTPFYNNDYVGYYVKCSRDRMLVYRRLTETQWRTAQLWFSSYTEDVDSTFYKGKYYILDESQNLTVINLASGFIEKIRVLPPDPNDKNLTFLIGSSQELLAVSEIFGRFNVYCVDLDCKNPRWVKKTSIGDLILFLDDCHGLSFTARDFPGFRGNCIYFLQSSDEFRCFNTPLRKYDLESGVTQVLYNFETPRMKECTWFMPSLQ